MCDSDVIDVGLVVRERCSGDKCVAPQSDSIRRFDGFDPAVGYAGVNIS